MQIVTSYLQILHLDHEGVPRDLHNHSTSLGYRIHRAYVNRWELKKADGQWMIRRRALLPFDGSPEPLKFLFKGLSDVLKERKGERVKGRL